MRTPTATDGRNPTRRVARLVLAGALVLAASACGAGGDAPLAAAPAPDPVTRPYCQAVVRVQAEQASPDAGQGGLATASAATRRQVAGLVRTAPPELARDWRTVQQLTDRALGVLAKSGGDGRKVDRPALDRLKRAGQPAQARIKQVTEQRCGISFRAPG